MNRMKKSKVTIITATLNSEKYLEQTILSVLNQTYENIEYIIVDGGSEDRTLEIVEKYENAISKVISESDNGIYDAFNKGIKLATGDIIYFLNSDDYLYNNKVIEMITNVFNENSEKNIVYGNVLSIDDEFKYINGKKLTLNDFKSGQMAPHQGVFVKKHLFEKYGLFETSYTIVADYDFLIKCFKDNKEQALYINETIAFFRLSGQGSDFNNLGLFNEMKKKVIEQHFGETKYSNGIEFQGLYRNWLESLLLKNQGITHVLHSYKVKNVAIFGTMKTAMYLLSDLQRENINVVKFLDNNTNMQRNLIQGIEVQSPLWLKENYSQIDAIILSIESNNDVYVKEQLEILTQDKNIQILSWKDLIMKYK